MSSLSPAFLSRLGPQTPNIDAFFSWLAERQSQIFVQNLKSPVLTLLNAGVAYVDIAATNRWRPNSDDHKTWDEGIEFVDGLWDHHPTVDENFILTHAPELLGSLKAMRNKFGITFRCISRFVAPEAYPHWVAELCTTLYNTSRPTIRLTFDETLYD